MPSDAGRARKLRQVSRPASPTSTGRLATIVLAVSVAVAFADSSIVVLALPQLYFDFHTTMFGVSWVITAYNLVVAVTAFALVPFLAPDLVDSGSPRRRRRVRRRVGGLRGGVVAVDAGGHSAAFREFGAARCWPAAPDLRRAHRLAGARRRCGGDSPGRSGPRSGRRSAGSSSRHFDWRAIFVVQAPIVSAAFVVPSTAAAHVPEAHESPHAHPSRPPRRAKSSASAHSSVRCSSPFSS